jgi:hypothetical protein
MDDESERVMRIDQADPLVTLHIERNADGTSELHARGILKGRQHTLLGMPLDALDLGDLRLHASELCARTLDALTAIAHQMPAPDPELEPFAVDRAIGANLDALADLAGVQRHGDRIGGVLDLLADQLRVPRAQVANAYNAIQRLPSGDQITRYVSGGGSTGWHGADPAADPSPPRALMLALSSDHVDRAIRVWDQLDLAERRHWIAFVRRFGTAPEIDELRSVVVTGRLYAASRPPPTSVPGGGVPRSG